MLRGASILAVVCVALAGGPANGPVPAAIQPAFETQSASSPGESDRLLGEGEALLKARKLEEARSRLDRALESGRAHGLLLQQARALVGLGEVDYNSNRDRPAKEYALQSLHLLEGTPDLRVEGRAEYLLGLVAERAGDRAGALECFARATAAFEHAGHFRGLALSHLGTARLIDATFPDREPLYEQAQADAKASADRTVEGWVLHSWGDGLFVAGQFERALQKLESAARLFESTTDEGDLGTVYNSLGRLYRSHGQVETALAFQLKALTIHERTASSFNHMQSLNAVAVTYQALGDWRKARIYFNRALQLAVQSGTPRIQDFIRANLAPALIEQEDYAEAARVLEGVLERGLDIYPSVRYAELAEVYLKLGRRDDALTAAAKAVEHCGAPGDLACINALDRRSQVQEARGNMTAALADLRSAVEQIERARARLIPADFFKQQFGSAQTSAYSRTIGMQLARGDSGEALETAELARSRAFIDLLASRDAPIEKRDPTSALARTSGVNAPPATTSDLVAVARRLQSTLLIYWVASDQVFIWTVEPGGRIRSTRVKVRDSRLAELVRSTAPFERGSAVAGRSNPWRELYDLLVLPVRDALPRTPGALVTIVPHGPLGLVAFAALQGPDGRYLLEDFTLHYVPAGAVLEFTAAKHRSNARLSGTLIVADPVLPPPSSFERPLPALPGARVEARAIARLASRPSLTMLEGRAATESGVRGNVAGKGVLHFATHAIVNDADPFSSFLALGRSSPEPAGDGILTAQEIYGLELQADLVVLSACRSGGGRVTGDGIATFARAFIYAGTPSLITSVWDVADKPTARLLPDFYERWRNGASKAQALRAAQLFLLGQLRDGKVTIETAAGPMLLPEHPALWAGFELIGEPD